MRPVTSPTVETGPHPGGEATRKTHPAFGLALFSRRSGGRDRLFGSELDSGQTIAFSVMQAEEIWHLSEKRYHAHRAPLIEIEMTPSQFAELVTTMNIGSGVPCTIRSLNHEQVPDFEDKDTLREQIHGDLKKTASDITRLVAQLEADLKTVCDGMSKTKRELLTKTVERIKMQLASNMPFVLDQYQEAVEKVTASAKAEIDSYVTHAVTTLGLKTLEELVGGKARPALAEPAEEVVREERDEDRLPYSTEDN